VVASVSVATSASGTSASLASLGETVQLVATARDAGPSGGSPIAGAAFTWTSDAPAVASVSASGIVTAAANGTAHVVAKASNQVSNAAPGFGVTVQQVVASVSVLPPTASIPRCTTQQFAATARDARGNAVAGAPAPAWSSADTGKATVNATSGLARGAGVGGPVAIQATIGPKTGSAQLTVNSSAITVNWSSAAAVTPVNVTTCLGQSVVWRNTDSNVVHSATGPTGSPNTGPIQPGTSSVAQSFPATGSYSYQCDYHPSESGTVTVTTP
jgi:plastocyanin